MGGDGGVIANQRKFLRAAKDGKDESEAEKKSSQESQRERAFTCALTNQKLGVHVVACKLGNLYDKEKLLEALLDKSIQLACPHIRGLRDVKDLVLTRNTRESTDESIPEYICPVTRIEFNGLHPFVVVWTTGKVLSEKALKEIGTDQLQDEFGPFTKEDIVRLLPTEDEATVMKSKLEELRLHSKKSSKKRTNDDAAAEGATTERKKISRAEAIVNHANKAVKLQSSNSGVFKNLFHDDSSKEMSDRDLFMSVAGIRYTLR
jgi:hypothetical protein